MGVYVLTDGTGSYIRHDKLTGKYVPIRSFKQAQQWDSQQKAHSVLNNSVPKAIRNNYAVNLVDTEHIVEKDDLSKQKEICFRSVEDGNIDEWLNKINIVMDAISGSESRKNELLEKLSDIDKQIVDIEHYIEFGKFNCYQGWMCFKMLQNTLQQRRKYKNEIAVLNLIKQCKFNKESLEALASTVADIQNKCYRPRAFPELFAGNERKRNAKED